jgi:predicted Zn-dependent protease
VFTTLSKSPQPAPYPLQHFFEYLERRSALTTEQQNETDLRALAAEVQQHPDRPRSLYLLAEDLLKLGRTEEAMQALQRLDALSGGDFRTELNSGVLLGRFRLYPDAIRYLQTALKINPASDEAKYNLGEALFRSSEYHEATQALLQISPDGQKDSSYQGLLGDVYARLGRFADASRCLQQATTSAPDNDQYYASLAAVQLQAGEIQDADRTVQRGLAHIPDSGLLYWTAGVVAVVRGNERHAETLLKKASQLSPSREAVAATLGIFYYEEGRVSDAREVLKRCIEMFPQSRLDFQKINAALDAATTSGAKKSGDISPEARREFYQLALAMRDQEQ